MVTHPHVKINLGLHVLRRRPDGYHDLETLFLPFKGFRDTLEIIAGDDWSRTSAGLFARYRPSQLAQALSEDGRLMITIARAEGVDWPPLKDLTARAYFLLSEDFPLPPIKIFLEKTAPVGAGLGGGSADAAFALRMLNGLCALGLSGAELAGYAARLGSDCACFLYDTPMFGTGRGEVLTPFDLDLDGYEVMVQVPEGVSVSTREAYAGVVPRLPAIPLREALARPIDEWEPVLHNDFEPSVFALHPEIQAVKEQLYHDGAVYASLSGSGSAVFGIFKK